MLTGDRIKERRKYLNLSADALANRLGVSRATIYRYESGDIEKVPGSALEPLALALRTTPAYLMGWDDDSVTTSRTLTVAEAQIGRAWGKAPQRDQRTVEHVLEPYMESDTAYSCFPLSAQPAAAGAGAYLGPEEFDMVDVDASKLPRGAKFGVPISGDSMEPIYHNGDIAIIGAEPPAVGQIGLFTLEGMGYIKRLGDGVLLSLNNGYDPIPMDEYTRCNGRVIGVITRDDVRG